MTSTGWAVVVAILIVLIVGGAWWYTAQAPTAPAEEINTTSGMPVPGSDVPEMEVINDSGAGAAVVVEAGVIVSKTIAVTYSDTGFSPATVTIKKGHTVIWKNESSGGMWVASAQHPTHTAYAGTSRSEHCGTAAAAQAFDQCSSTGDFSFTFDKVGTWAYHDHVNSSRFGKVVVE